jgi:hypothetical protein
MQNSGVVQSDSKLFEDVSGESQNWLHRRPLKACVQASLTYQYSETNVMHFYSVY